MAKLPNIRSDGQPLFVRIPGKSRRYRNTENGQVISRRQYDRLYGSLAEGGFSSYEKKAKSTTAEIRAQRPARGRKTSYATLKPTGGKAYRYVDAGSTVESYDNVLSQLQRNKLIFSLALIAVFVDLDDMTVAYSQYLMSSTLPPDMPSGRQALDMAENWPSHGPLGSKPAAFVHFIIHVRFFSDAVQEVPKSRNTDKRRNTRSQQSLKKPKTSVKKKGARGGDRRSFGQQKRKA
jgi:hypothetical protein